MSSSYYVLLDKSVLTEDNINDVLQKLKTPYNDESMDLSIITIGDFILASNYSIYDTDNNLKMVCKGNIKNTSDLCIIYDMPNDNDGFNVIYKTLCTHSNFEDVSRICEKLNSISGNFSIIAINNNGEYILTTDRQGSEKIYVGYIADKPVIYSNYNIQMYFNECLELDKTNSVIDGYLELNLKSGKQIQKYSKSLFDNFDPSSLSNNRYTPSYISSNISCNISCGGVYGMGIMGSADVITSMGGISNMNSLFGGLGDISSINGNINSMYDTNTALDAAFAPLIGDYSGSNANDYETRLGKYGTSILDKMICWEDTQKRYPLYKTPPISIQLYYDNNFFNNYTSDTSISSCKIDIVNNDLIDIALDMLDRGLNPVVLNMTDKHYPAVNIQQGTSGQEESFFRRSNYGQTLIVDLYPINDSGVVYSNGVTIFKDSEKNGWKILERERRISFIACPPIKSPYNLLYDFTKLFENASLNEEQEIITKIRLSTFLQAAIKTGHNSIVIPAFGCEGHKNPPCHIANILKALVEQYKSFFTEIVIGIPDIDDSYLGNFRIFKRVFSFENDISTTAIHLETSKTSETSETSEDEISIDELLEEL